MDSDGLEEYLRALKVVIGLGPLYGLSLGISGNNSSSIAALVLAGGQQTCVSTVLQESLSGDSVDNVTLVSTGPPTDGGIKESKRAPAARKPRGKRKRETTDAGPLVVQVAGDPKRAYTIDEAARIYSISRSSLYNAINAGILPDVKLFGRRILPRDAMEALIKSPSK